MERKKFEHVFSCGCVWQETEAGGEIELQECEECSPDGVARVRRVPFVAIQTDDGEYQLKEEVK